MKTMFKLINMLSIFTLCFSNMSFLLHCSIIINLYKSCLFFVICFFTASEPDDEDFVLCELLKPPKDASYEVCRICE